MRTLLLGIVLVILMGASGAQGFKRVGQGDLFRDFEAGTVEGRPFRLSENLGSRATVVLFWAAWSPRSAEALRDFRELHEAHGPQGLQVVAVNVEHQDLGPEEIGSVASFAEKEGGSIPVVIDRGLSVFDAWGVVAVPSVVLLDAEGRVVEVLDGYALTTRDLFLDRVRGALGLEAAPAPRAAAAEAPGCPGGTAVRYFRMGELFLGKRMAEKAAQSFAQAAEADPGCARTHLRLAEALEAAGRPDEAARARAAAAALPAGTP